MEASPQLTFSEKVNQRLIEFYQNDKETRLDLSGLDIKDEELRLILAALEGSQELSLRFPEPSAFITKTITRNIKLSSRVISEIDLSNNPLASSITDVAEYANKNKNLKILNLNNINPNDIFIFNFINILKLNKTLEQLYFDASSSYSDLFIVNWFAELSATIPSLKKLSLRNYDFKIQSRKDSLMLQRLVNSFSRLQNGSNNIVELQLARDGEKSSFPTANEKYKVELSNQKKVIESFNKNFESGLALYLLMETLSHERTDLNLIIQFMTPDFAENIIGKIMADENIQLEIKYKLIMVFMHHLYPGIPDRLEQIFTQAVTFLAKGITDFVKNSDLIKELEVNAIVSWKQIKLAVRELSSFLDSFGSIRFNIFSKEIELLNTIDSNNNFEINSVVEICRFLQKMIIVVKNRIEYEIANFQKTIAVIFDSVGRRDEEYERRLEYNKYWLSSFNLMIKNSTLQYFNLSENPKILVLESVLLAPDKPLIISELPEQDKIDEINCDEIKNILTQDKSRTDFLSVIRKSLFEDLSESFDIDWRFNVNGDLPNLLESYAQSDLDGKNEIELFFSRNDGVDKLFAWFTENLWNPIKIAKLVNDENVAIFFKAMLSRWIKDKNPQAFALIAWTTQDINFLNCKTLNETINFFSKNKTVAKSLLAIKNVLEARNINSGDLENLGYVNLSGAKFNTHFDMQYAPNMASSSDQNNYLVRFSGANLRNADFTAVKKGMSYSRFDQCWLQNTKFGKELQRCLFQKTTIKQSDWSGLLLNNSEFDGSTLIAENGKIENANFSNSKINNCSWARLRFSSCDFSHAEFSNTDLTQSQLSLSYDTTFVQCTGLTQQQMPKDDETFKQIKIASLNQLIPRIFSCYDLNDLLSIYEKEKNNILPMKRGFLKSSTWNIALIVFQYRLVRLLEYRYGNELEKINELRKELVNEQVDKPNKNYLVQLNFNKSSLPCQMQSKNTQEIIEQLYDEVLKNKLNLHDSQLPRASL